MGLGDDALYVEVGLSVGVGVGINSAVFSVFEIFSNAFHVMFPVSDDVVVQDSGRVKIMILHVAV